MRARLPPFIAALTALAASGCARDSLLCETNEDCVQGGIAGTCRPSPSSSSSWCSFPDPDCAESGHRWGAAAGDGLAAQCVTESTEDGGLEDGGPPPDAPPATDFSTRIGGTGEDSFRQVVGADRELYVFSNFSGASEFGGEPLNSAGSSDFFVARLAWDGTSDWVRSFGGVADEQAIAIAAMPDGGVAILGTFTGHTRIGNQERGSVGGSVDLFLLKLSKEGDVAWAKLLGSGSNEVPVGLAADAAGELFITGFFDGITNLGDGSLTSAGDDAFLARYRGSDGRTLWSTKIGGPGAEWPAAISARGPSVAIAGRAIGEVNLGNGPRSLPQSGSFVASYAATSGIHDWSRIITAEALLSPTYANALALTREGNAIVCGHFSASADFGAGSIASRGGTDAFVAHYNVGGSLLWLRQLGADQGDGCQLVAMGPDDSVHVAGRFMRTVDFGAQQLTSSGNAESDLFVAKYTLANEPVHAMKIGNAASESLSGLAAEPLVVVTGSFSGTMNVGDTDLVSAGGLDTFVLGRVFP